MPRGEPPGQQLGGLECGQRRRVAISRHLKNPADEAGRGRHSGLGFGPDRAFGALQPALGLLQPFLPGQLDCDYPADEQGQYQQARAQRGGDQDDCQACGQQASRRWAEIRQATVP